MSIITGPEINSAIGRGEIKVSPYDPDNVGINSLDLRIGDSIKVYVDKHGRPLDAAYRDAISAFPLDGLNDRPERNLLTYLESAEAILDMRKPPRTASLIIPDEGFVLLPDRGYLAATIETVGTESYVPILHGRSSVGRLFVSVHHTAGFGDIGFEGTWTLEVTAIHPTRIYPGTRLCQIAFETFNGVPDNYGTRTTSKYQHQTEPGESRLWVDFDEQE